MAHHDDSTITQLQELVRMERDREENERFARVEANARREAEVKADAAREKAERLEKLQAEIATAEQLRAEATRAIEESAAREVALRSSFEREQVVRAEARRAAHEAAVAALRESTGSPRVGVWTIVAIVGLAVVGLGGATIAAVESNERAVSASRAQHRAAMAAGATEIATLRGQIDRARDDVRTAEATVVRLRASTAALLAAIPARVEPRAGGRPGHSAGRHTSTATSTNVAQDPGITGIDVDGNDPITAVGIEGGRSSRTPRRAHR